MLDLKSNTTRIESNIVEEITERLDSQDIDIFQETLTQDRYSDTLLNLTKLWLLSNRYDRVRRPGWAGFCDDLLRRYPMNEEGAAQCKSDLFTEANKAVPDVKFTEPYAEPQLQTQTWDIGITAVNIQTGMSTAKLKKEQRGITIDTVGK